MSQTPNSMQPATNAEKVLSQVGILEQGNIEAEHGMMRWSSNYTFLVSLTHEDTSIMAVYKPQKGERPLWDFADGTLCYREVAAFHASQALGWQLVPPTVLRQGPRGLGSMQHFIEHDPEMNYFSFDQRMIPQLMRMAAFDYVVNNADRKGGHCLVDCDDHLWGIDHGITFHRAPKLRTVIWDFAEQPVPDALLADLERLCGVIHDLESDVYRRLKPLLADDEIRAFQARARHILKTKRYPRPGPGPNYPWPPV